MKIGRKLRELRLAGKLSQGDIEQRTGLLRAYTSRVENGHVSPSIGTLEKYAEAFGVPLYTLFYDGPRRTEFDVKLENKKVRRDAAKNQPPQYEMFVETVAGLSDRQRALFMHVANKLARRGGVSRQAFGGTARTMRRLNPHPSKTEERGTRKFHGV
jgi:transcriptional regulator with XRE-family HTH domain